MVPPSLFFFTNKKRRPLKCYLKTMVSWGGGGVLGRHHWPQQMTLDYHISKAEIRLRMILVRGQQTFSYNGADNKYFRLCGPYSLHCTYSVLLLCRV